MTRRIPLVSVALLAGVAAACAKKPPEAAPAPAPAPPPAAAAPAIDSSRIRDSLNNLRLAAEREARMREQAAAALAAARAALVASIHFDFDKSDLRDQDRAILDSKVPVLNANPGLRIQIAGNCDKRGSAEYNLALGQRRAAAAKRYLVEHGIDAGRIDVISYGKEHPVDNGDTEEAYAQNRRDDFVIVAGGDNLRAASLGAGTAMLALQTR
jgi:peptidoglycan-associated lipoprotein